MELRDFAVLCGDTNLTELVSARSYRQALKNIDKKLKKKTPRSFHLHVLRVGLLTKAGERDAALAAWNLLRESKDAVSNESIRTVLFSIAVELKEDGVLVDDKAVEGLFIGAAFEGAKAEGQIEMLEDWVYLSIDAEQWVWVVRATQRLFGLFEKTSVRYKKYWLWHYLARYQSHLLLLHATGKGSWLDQKITYGSLLKAAKFHETPESDKTRAPVPLNTSQELAFFVDIAMREMEGNEAVLKDLAVILRQDSLKDVATSDYQFSQALSQTMAKAAPHEEFEHAQVVLVKANKDGLDCQSDDWKNWNNLNTAYTKKQLVAKNTGLNEDYREFVRQHSFDDRPSRNRDLASLTLEVTLNASAAIAASTPPETNNDLQLVYFQKNCKQPYVAPDLARILDFAKDKASVLATIRGWIAKLSPTSEEGETSREWARWLRAQVNYLRLEGLDLNNQPASLELQPQLEKHVQACVNLCKWATGHKDLLPEPDQRAAIETLPSAIRAITTLASQNINHNLHCAILLAHKAAKSNTHCRLDAQILSLHLLQQSYASTTEAWTLYNKLDAIKMLVEPMAPVMFLRISTRHPHKSLNLDTYVALAKPLNYYTQTLLEISHAQETALSKGNLAQCLDMTDLAHEHKASLARWELGLERRRIARLRGIRYDELDLAHDPAKLPLLCDKVRAPWKSCPGGALSKGYVQFLSALDQVAEYVRCDPILEPDHFERITQRLEPLRGADPEAMKKALRETEVESLGVHALFCAALMFAGMGDEKHVIENLDGVVKAIPRFLSKEVHGVGSREGPGMIVSDLITAFECLDLCNSLAMKLSKRLQKMAEVMTVLETLKGTISEQMGEIRAFARAHIAALKKIYTADDFMADMRKNGEGWEKMGKNVLELVGEGHAVDLWRRMQVDASESFEGVLRLTTVDH